MANSASYAEVLGRGLFLDEESKAWLHHEVQSYKTGDDLIAWALLNNLQDHDIVQERLHILAADAPKYNFVISCPDIDTLRKWAIENNWLNRTVVRKRLEYLNKEKEAMDKWLMECDQGK